MSLLKEKCYMFWVFWYVQFILGNVNLFISTCEICTLIVRCKHIRCTVRLFYIHMCSVKCSLLLLCWSSHFFVYFFGHTKSVYSKLHRNALTWLSVSHPNINFMQFLHIVHSFLLVIHAHHVICSRTLLCLHSICSHSYLYVHLISLFCSKIDYIQCPTEKYLHSKYREKKCLHIETVNQGIHSDCDQYWCCLKWKKMKNET